MQDLSPLNYTIHLCHVAWTKSLAPVCMTALFLLFGDDYTAIVIALIMLAVDTIIGSTAAIIQNEFSNRNWWRVVPKFVAIVSAFVVGNLLVIFEPKFGSVLEYAIVSVIIFSETISILENAAKIHPDLNFKKVFDKLRK